MGEYAERSWGKRRVGAFGHHAASMLMVCIVAAVWFGLFPPAYPYSSDPLSMALFVAPIMVLGLSVLCFLRMRVHDRSLCESCASAIPLNPAARAKRLRRRFEVAHRVAEPRFLVPYVAVLIGSNFAANEPARIGWALVQLTMIYMIMSHTTHRLLQPWCPWCSGDGGGEEVDDTSPTLPTDGRQRA